MTRPRRPRHLEVVPPAPNPLASNGGAIWLGRTPTGTELERMSGEQFHEAVDKLLADTVPESYWRQVVARRHAEARDRINHPSDRFT